MFILGTRLAGKSGGGQASSGRGGKVKAEKLKS
jgi:hypothetical protein